MASSSTPDTTNFTDQNIPQWKKELLARRRALGRTLPAGNTTVKLTCPSVVAAVRQPEVTAVQNVISKQQRCISSVTVSNKRSLDQNQADFHPCSSADVSVRNMRLLDKCVHNDLVTNGSDKQCNQSIIDSFIYLGTNMGEEKIVNNKNNSNIYNKSMEKISVKISKSVKREPVTKKNENSEECSSDSSEELQYGPGIVNRLKTRYLSMTLRESQKKGIRPSLWSMRRATSLENMLDEDSCPNRMSKPNMSNQLYNNYQKNMNISNKVTNITQRTSKFVVRPSNPGLESMKRAVSMDTLLKRDQIHDPPRPKSLISDITICNGNTNSLASIINEDLIIVETTSCGDKNKHISNEDNFRGKYNTNKGNKDLPPPDLVKQTLKLFETSPRKFRSSNMQNKTSIQKLIKANNVTAANHNSEKNTYKPNLSPKPVLSPDKLKPNHLTKKPAPKKLSHQKSNNSSNTVHSSKSIQNQEIEPVSLILTNRSRSASEKQSTSISPKLVSPRSVSPVVMVIAHGEHNKIMPPSTSCNSRPEPSQFYNKTSDDDSSDEEEFKLSKPISETALENIRKGGTSTQFKFNIGNSHSSKIKTYLPRNDVHVQASNSVIILSPTRQSSPPTATIAPMKHTDTVVLMPKQVGVIRPIVSTKINSNVSSNSPPGLTEQEIEKNIINRVKSIEQPVSKVIVAIKTFPENIVLGSISSDNKCLSLTNMHTNLETKPQGLWDKKPWQNQNTMVFNFSNRKDVPDYIENDGLILKGQRERPRPGEGGIILLDGAGQESSTDVDSEDWISDPPSPCDVAFEGDNVLINGKSNLSKQPKQIKLRIHFNDEATTMFEYPSETSMAEEGEELATTTSDSTSAISMPIGGTLGNYTPRQLGHDSGESFQLGVSRSVPQTSRVVAVEDLDITPTPPECTVAWSEGSAPDLLF